MTSTAGEIVNEFLAAADFGALSTRIDGVAMVLLIVLLAELEMVRVFGGPEARARIVSLRVAVAPLLLAFILVVVVRSLGLK